jgi:hypothetical protein
MCARRGRAPVTTTWIRIRQGNPKVKLHPVIFSKPQEQRVEHVHVFTNLLNQNPEKPHRILDQKHRLGIVHENLQR